MFVIKVPIQNTDGGVQQIAGELGFDRFQYVTRNYLYFPTSAPQYFETFRAGEEQFTTSEVSSFVITHVLRVQKEPGKSHLELKLTVPLFSNHQQLKQTNLLCNDNKRRCISAVGNSHTFPLLNIYVKSQILLTFNHILRDLSGFNLFFVNLRRRCT